MFSETIYMQENNTYDAAQTPTSRTDSKTTSHFLMLWEATVRLVSPPVTYNHTPLTNV